MSEQQPSPTRKRIIILAAALIMAHSVYLLFVLPKKEREEVSEIYRQAQQQTQHRPAGAQTGQQGGSPDENNVRLHRLNEGIAYSAALRTDIAVFLADHGRLPATLREINIEGVEEHMPAGLDKIEVAEGGRILLHFSAKAGLKGTVILTPDADQGSGTIQNWICTSSDFPSIAEARHECRYVPR